ncbi:hypothetical protein EVAR_42966_1 [Eumeta japonica]|uniref:FLYWCH-type domain-containing protein n=1 Tax=Eumeta variegata TaxID=151549 RepID=A0A4C1YFN2_EUMVA|nr:hypothetical protein EVAR_42966_1 [Eumeta japonica]
MQHKAHINSLKQRWRCSKEHNNCKAVIYTVSNQIVSVKDCHNHPPKFFPNYRILKDEERQQRDQAQRAHIQLSHKQNLEDPLALRQAVLWVQSRNTHMAKIEFTQKGNRHLKLNGFKYALHTMSRLKTRWRCMRHNYGCKAVVHTMEDVIVSMKNEHNHMPNE